MLREMLQRLRLTRRSRPVVEASESLSRNVDRLLEGRWTAEDIIELQFDEVSTAGSVGSGPDRQLGGIGKGTQAPVSTKKRDKGDWSEAIVQRFVEYRTRTGQADVVEFVDKYAPGLSLNTRRALVKHLRGLT